MRYDGLFTVPDTDRSEFSRVAGWHELGWHLGGSEFPVHLRQRHASGSLGVIVPANAGCSCGATMRVMRPTMSISSKASLGLRH
jgi:hypothetical protein